MQLFASVYAVSVDPPSIRRRSAIGRPVDLRQCAPPENRTHFLSWRSALAGLIARFDHLFSVKSASDDAYWNGSFYKFYSLSLAPKLGALAASSRLRSVSTGSDAARMWTGF